jgi:hypothetical protein
MSLAIQGYSPGAKSVLVNTGDRVEIVKRFRRNEIAWRRGWRGTVTRIRKRKAGKPAKILINVRIDLEDDVRLDIEHIDTVFFNNHFKIL